MSFHNFIYDHPDIIFSKRNRGPRGLTASRSVLIQGTKHKSGRVLCSMNYVSPGVWLGVCEYRTVHRIVYAHGIKPAIFSWLTIAANYGNAFPRKMEGKGDLIPLPLLDFHEVRGQEACEEALKNFAPLFEQS